MPLPDDGLAAYGNTLFGLRSLNEGSAAALPSMEGAACSGAVPALLLVALVGLDGAACTGAVPALLLEELDGHAAAGAPVVVLVIVMVVRERRNLAAPSDQGSLPVCQGSASGARAASTVTCSGSESLLDESQARESRWHSLQQKWLLFSITHSLHTNSSCSSHS